MRPSQTAFYDFTPNEIDLNVLTNRYSKIPYEDACFTTINRFNYYDGGYDTSETMFNEGLLSMYLPITIDGHSTEYTDVRNSTNMFGSGGNKIATGDYNVFVTDGHNKNLTSINISTNASPAYNTINFRTMKEMNGCVSIGKTFTVDTVNKPALGTRASIGTHFNILDEAEQVVNDIIEKTDITYTTTTDTANYYEKFDIQGLDSFTAANLVAGLKDRKLIVDGKTVKLVKNIEDTDYTNLYFSEKSSANRIINISRDNTLYDFYNQITVYGKGVKHVVRDARSIRNNGLKELEEVNLSILTKEAASRRAHKLLKIHRSAKDGIKMTVLYSQCPFLRPGQIITINYPSQKIPRNDYVVLDVTYNIMQGTMEILAGVYTKNLTNRIAELVADGKTVHASLRGNRFETQDIGSQTQDEIKVRGVKLKISETTSTGGSSTFGFGATFGFGTTFGFSGTGSGSGSTSSEVLREYDLL